MRRRGSWVIAFILVPSALAGACGGRTLDDPLADQGTRTDGGVVASGGQAGTGGRGTTTGSSAARGSEDEYSGLTSLPPCQPGPVATNSAHPCSWVAKNRCYETKVEACACACPSRNGTTCSSGFPDDDGRVLVTCG